MQNEHQFFLVYQLGVRGGVNPVGTYYQVFPQINFWGHPEIEKTKLELV